jgi:hypothetical protein
MVMKQGMQRCSLAGADSGVVLFCVWCVCVGGGQRLGLRLLELEEGRAVEEDLLLALAQLDAADAQDAAYAANAALGT